MRWVWVAVLTCGLAGCGDDESTAPADSALDAAADAAMADRALDAAPDSAPVDGARPDAMTMVVACPANCMCTAGNSCNFACGASGCNLAECLNASCTASCTGGMCGLDCDVGATCDYACPGGDCVSDCDGNSSCNVACSGGGCDLVCDGASTCRLDCTGASKRCTISCTAGGHATCLGNCNIPSC